MIAIDIREIQKGVLTGIGRMVTTFLDELTEGDRQNYILFGDVKTDISKYNDKFKVVVLKAPSTLWFDQISLVVAIVKYKIDVFYSPYFKIPLLAPCKKIATICDLHFLEDILRSSIKEKLKPYNVFLKLVLKHADKIMAISEYTKSDILSKFSVEESKIRVVHLSVDKIFFANSDNPIEKKKYILYCGNMKAHKNIPTLIRAFATLSSDLKNIYKIVLVSRKDENYPALKKLIVSLKLESCVSILEYVDNLELAKLYREARVLVHPSFHEGFGYSPLEAMASRTAALAADSTSLKEVVADGGLLFDPNETAALSEILNDVLTDDEFCARLIEKGSRRVKEFTAQRYLIRMKDLLETGR